MSQTNQVLVYDGLGRKIKVSKLISTGLMQIDLQSCPDGLYNIIVLDSNGTQLKALKLLKQNR